MSMIDKRPGRRPRGGVILRFVVQYDNMSVDDPHTANFMAEGGRAGFASFTIEAQEEAAQALTIAAAGGKAAMAKPLKSLDGGVFEIAHRHRGDAFWVIYVVQIDEALWVLHAFKKKSKTGIKTPKSEVDLIRERLRRLKEALR